EKPGTRSRRPTQACKTEQEDSRGNPDGRKPKAGVTERVHRVAETRKDQIGKDREQRNHAQHAFATRRRRPQQLRNAQQWKEPDVEAWPFEVVAPARVAVTGAEQILAEEAADFRRNRAPAVEAESLSQHRMQNGLVAGYARTVQEVVRGRQDEWRGQQQPDDAPGRE